MAQTSDLYSNNLDLSAMLFDLASSHRSLKEEDWLTHNPSLQSDDFYRGEFRRTVSDEYETEIVSPLSSPDAIERRDFNAFIEPNFGHATPRGFEVFYPEISELLSQGCDIDPNDSVRSELITSYPNTPASSVKPARNPLRSPFLSKHSGRRAWSANHYSQIIEASKGGVEAMYNTAAQLHMPLGTARRIVRQYRNDASHIQPKQRGGAHHRVYDEQSVMQQLIPWLESGSNASSSLDDMRSHLQQDCGMDRVPSRTTLSKWLEAELLLVNQCDSVITTDPTDVIKRLSDWAAASSIDLANVVFVAEFTAVLWTKRNRSLDSQQACQDIDPPRVDELLANQRNVSVNCFVAVTLTNPSKPLMQFGTSVSKFLRECATWYTANHVSYQQPIFFADMANLEHCRDTTAFRCQHRVLDARLEPAGINIAELVIEQHKPMMRAEHAKRKAELLQTDMSEWDHKHTARLHILHALLSYSWR
jgi:hypothetical protein